MNVRQPEHPRPPEEPAPGYFAPPPELVVGQEWRLIQPLRDAALTMNATNTLTEAVVAQCEYHLTGSSPHLGMAFADLAVTGRGSYQSFVALKPQGGGPIGAAAATRLLILRTPGVTPQLVLRAESEVLDRAYQVAWFLRGQIPRDNLGWITVSGEDDLPHRPVNVPRTQFPQCDLYFTVNGDLGPVVVQTRYAIATATEPDPIQVSLPKRSLPPVFNPALPPNDRIILFILGSDSRLEEANDIIPKLVRLPDGRPSGFCVISLDMPGSGYVNPIDHTEVGPWTPATFPTWPPVGAGAVTISVLPFMERFLVSFVAALSSRLGQPGLVESRIAAVMGGSLGGNLALRLARRSEPWLRNSSAIAFSAGSVWHTAGPVVRGDQEETKDAGMLQAGVVLGIPSVGAPEAPASRDQFFASAFDQKLPFKTQPDQWYRDDFPNKMQYITNARLDRRETYTPQYRRWHWRVSVEELLWSWRDSGVQNFKSRVLLGAGSEDDILPAHIYTNTRKLAAALTGTNGDSFFFENTGHSIHAERPDALAQRIMEFLTSPMWESLGGVLTSGPAVSSWAAGRLDVFARGLDNSLVHKWYDNNWSGWESLGGDLTSAPAAVSWGHGRIDVFARGLGNALWHQWYDGNWSGWESLGGGLTSGPTVSSWAPGRLDVFARGFDNSLERRWFDNNNWSGWESLGGDLTSDPAAVSWAPGRLDVFARGTDNSLVHTWYDQGWSGWESLGGALSSGPDVSSWAPGRLDVFARGTDNRLVHKWFDNNNWSGWESLGGDLTSDPAAVSWGNGRIDVFARSTDDALRHKWYDQQWRP